MNGRKHYCLKNPSSAALLPGAPASELIFADGRLLNFARYFADGDKLAPGEATRVSELVSAADHVAMSARSSLRAMAKLLEYNENRAVEPDVFLDVAAGIDLCAELLEACDTAISNGTDSLWRSGFDPVKMHCERLRKTRSKGMQQEGGSHG